MDKILDTLEHLTHSMEKVVKYLDAIEEDSQRRDNLIWEAFKITQEIKSYVQIARLY